MPGAVAGAWALCAWIALGFTKEQFKLFKEYFQHRRERAQREAELRFAQIEGRAERLRARYDPHGQATLSEVSEMVDVVRLGLSAGLSFDAALELFCANRSTKLSRALDVARISWQIGVSSRESELLGVAARMKVRALESFAVTVGQALALGSPLAEPLATQSREMRAAHRSEVERQIERAPVKLLIPTGTLILPALLLSILGPLLAAGGMV